LSQTSLCSLRPRYNPQSRQAVALENAVCDELASLTPHEEETMLHTKAPWLLALLLTFTLSCGDDDDKDDSDDGGTSADGSDDGSGSGDDGSDSSDSGGDGGGTDNPYGPCETEADCPIEGSRCPASSGGCLPPCTDVSECPEVPGYSLVCEGDTCSIPCSVSDPCPTGMTCLAGITCGWP